MIDQNRFAEAVRYAAGAHDGHLRKGTAIPYLSHLLAVAGLVMEDGGDTDGAIAALLHDVIEDRNDDGGRPDEIRALFGADVLAVVRACSGPKAEDEGMADFRTRKGIYLEHLRAQENPSAIRVSLADKVHNARSTVNDLEAAGASVWSRFNAGYVDQIWWYTGLSEVYARHAEAGRANPARAAELARLVARMRDFGVPTGAEHP